jgi:lipid-binding SYLF domain-containing protein
MRYKSLFVAGIDISGGVLGPDKNANADVYGPNVDPKEIAFGTSGT